MIVLDTTILVYATGSEHPLRDSCRTLISVIRDSRITATTTVEAIQEFAHVFARRRSPAEATGLAREYAELLSPLLTIDKRHLLHGLRLFEASTAGLGAFDAVLAARALDQDAAQLVSADRAFAEVPNLRHVFPDAAGVAALLG